MQALLSVLSALQPTEALVKAAAITDTPALVVADGSVQLWSCLKYLPTVCVTLKSNATTSKQGKGSFCSTEPKSVEVLCSLSKHDLLLVFCVLVLTAQLSV